MRAELMAAREAARKRAEREAAEARRRELLARPGRRRQPSAALVFKRALMAEYDEKKRALK